MFLFKEKIKLIPNYTNYLISESGCIFSSVRNGWFEPLKPWVDNKGYLRINLGRKDRYGIHELVALAFIGPRTKPTINHKDGNKLNNHYENLEYVEYSENNKHAYDLGLKTGYFAGKTGTQTSRAKFTKEDILLIRSLYKKGNKIESISNSFNVHFSTIHRIINNITYKEIP